MRRLGWLVFVLAAVIIPAIIFFLRTPELRIGFGEHVVAGIVAVVIVTYAVERPLEKHYRDIKRLDPIQFSREVACAKTSIKIMDIWMKSFLLGSNYKLFHKAILAAVRDGIEVQILVAKPDCFIAQMRAKTLSDYAGEFIDKSPEDIVAMMKECVRILVALNKEIDSKMLDRKSPIKANTLSVRLFEAPISLAMYKVDDISYWTHFHYDRLALDSDQYVTTSNKGPAAFMGQHFNMLWNDANTIDLNSDDMP